MRIIDFSYDDFVVYGKFAFGTIYLRSSNFDSYSNSCNSSNNIGSTITTKVNQTIKNLYTGAPFSQGAICLPYYTIEDEGPSLSYR